VYNWHVGEENFGLSFDQTTVASVPASSIQIKAMDIHTLLEIIFNIENIFQSSNGDTVVPALRLI
jgi:hypothetical protein